MSASLDPPASSDETAVKPVEARADATERFTPGTLLAGRFRIVSPLGKGGMGEVYRADDIRLGQPVALKFLPTAFAADSGRLQRLVDEVRIGRQISHPNVCRLYDIAEAEGHHFLVMEYVDGEDLASLLSRIGHLPGDKALDIARGMCAGLAAAHDKGIIHRDLKPANVMIDGRGHARIADFGLAALAHSGGAADMSGTPQYMAPEQLTGEGASLRSDVYALGLVLHEMLTGKRVFDAKSLNELRALHADTKPPSLSSSAPDVDPAFERLILRCLDRNPNDRPASARLVLASLPGGDQLEAAVLAGETPSPEMVAAAAIVGDLQPRVAWACLVAGIVGLLLIPIQAGYVMLFPRVPLPNPPEALVYRAKAVLSRLGYGEAPPPAISASWNVVNLIVGADSAYGFGLDSAFFDHVRENVPPAAQWTTLGTARPGPFLFYYRESPNALVSTNWSPGWALPPGLGRLTEDDPPLNVPGMTRVVLDPLGRLTSFLAVPPRFDPKPERSPDLDWSIVLTEAGFDPVRLQPSASRGAAPVDSDRKAAWDGVLPDHPDVTFHIEAAGYRGRLTYFAMQGPWVQPRRATSVNIARVLAAAMFVIALIAFFLGVLLPAGAVLVRRNLRLGRGDRRGAVRLAVFTFSSVALADLFEADHTGLPVHEYSLLIQIAGQAFYYALLSWLVYMALEPAIRRRWPQSLISWNRLLAGRFRDPLLGRDVLVGALAGMAVLFVYRLNPAGVSPSRSVAEVVEANLKALNSPRHLVFAFFLYLFLGVSYSVLILFTRYLLHSLVNGDWLSHLLVLVFYGAAVYLSRNPLTPAKGAIALAIILAVLSRVGLLASAMLFFTLLMLASAPLTLDWTAWYAGRSFAVLGFFAALLVAAFYTSLGGKPLFGKALLED